jgi:RimJ/RimL family protein N-acetyltransferase
VIGVLRFDRQGAEHAVISVYLIPQETGRGLGVASIRLGCHRITQEWKVRRVLAHVRKDNPIGSKGFRKAGFSSYPFDATCPVGHEALCWDPSHEGVFERSDSEATGQ